MAEFYSDLLTEIVTNNKTPASNITGRAGVFSVCAKVTVLSSHADGDVYRMFRVPTSGVPVAQFISNSAITGGTDYDAGLYNNGLNQAVLDKDVLFDGVSMATAANNVVISGVQLIANDGKAFWQLAGLSADPGGELTVAITANTVGSADGTIFYVLFYNANS